METSTKGDRTTTKIGVSLTDQGYLVIVGEVIEHQGSHSIKINREEIEVLRRLLLGAEQQLDQMEQLRLEHEKYVLDAKARPR